MKMQKTPLGGYRLGSGNKNQVELEDFSYSNHDLGNVWRSTMSAGTLVPFLVQPALPGDHWTIDLQANCLTLPTIAPVFGSFKIQLDLFSVPMRLYNSWTHNNKLNIGLHMGNVKLPIFNITAMNENGPWYQANKYPYPINNSNILKYLGISGPGRFVDPVNQDYYQERQFNAVPLLGYWDIFKNYYANKQEDNAWVIAGYTGSPVITNIYWSQDPQRIANNFATVPIPASTGQQYAFSIQTGSKGALWVLNSLWLRETGTGTPICTIANFYKGTPVFLGTFNGTYPPVVPAANTVNWYYWFYADGFIQTDGISQQQDTFATYQTLINQNYSITPQLVPFALTEIDDLRSAILATDGGTNFDVRAWGTTNSKELVLSTLGKTVANSTDAEANCVQYRYSQSGLLLKTYQSDIFNNWLNEETFTGAGGITAVTNIDVSAGYLNIDALELGYKVYKMLNQIAVSGGSYDDWQIAVYNHERFAAPEIPIYLGGLSKELTFTELWSTAPGGYQSIQPNGQNQPLGTLTGRGTMTAKHKGGYIEHTVNELSFIMGIVSITPRLDYSQGNDWFTGTSTFNDWHKPHLDQIGFQDLMAEQLAWFGVTSTTGASWVQHGIGKQPAWINYMTNYNRDFGQFAEANNLMCMVINRRYAEADPTIFNTQPIADVTTYIEPQLYNYLFAQVSTDAQNFWMQVKADITARRKMSAKIMPNL